MRAYVSLPSMDSQGLMNKKQQKQKDDYGHHYPFNIASEDDVRIPSSTEMPLYGA